jgi:predicted lactoylglutathione lyase
MGMEEEGQLSAYRERLLDSLRDFPERRRRERPDSLRVFVNQECVGTLPCGGAGSMSIFTSRGRPVHAIEVRTSTGLLVGGLCAETAGMRRAEFPVAKRTLEVNVENRLEGGSVRVAYCAASPVWDWFKNRLTAVKTGMAGQSLSLSPDFWRMARVAGQAALVVSVLLLAADRLTDRWGLKETVARFTTIAETSGMKLAAAEDALIRQEKVLTGLARTVKAQKQHLTRVERAVGVMAQEQQHFSASVETRVFAELSRATTDRERMRDQIQSLTVAKDAMSKDIAVLETRAQVAEIRQETQVRPFMFWVSFQDGTPEESIDSLIREIHGRTGQINAGWYKVEVSLPQPQTADSFVESLKKATIVKAVKTSLNTSPDQ